MYICIFYNQKIIIYLQITIFKLMLKTMIKIKQWYEHSISFFFFIFLFVPTYIIIWNRENVNELQISKVDRF